MNGAERPDLAGLPAIPFEELHEEECMATRKRDRALERVPDGIFPADRDAPLDPGALHKFLLRGAPLTAAQSRALVVEANKRTRRAAAAREKQHREFMEAMDRGDWPQAGNLFAAQQREHLARVAPLVVKSGLVRPNPSRGREPRALDPLGDVLLEILSRDPYKAGKDVLTALRMMAGKHPVIIAVRRIARKPPRKRGDLVVWRHPSNGEKKTLWTSIQGQRLTRIRKLLKAPQRSRTPR
jgi:hypothetical protein